jgi:hypothetical protein
MCHALVAHWLLHVAGPALCCNSCAPTTRYIELQLHEQCAACR